MGPELFVTMFVARYTPETGKLMYSSAGHDPCYICRGSKSERSLELPSQGPVLGIFPEVELEDCEHILQPGDSLLLYTDGLVNVRCEHEYSVDSRRLCNTLRKHGNLPAQAQAQGLFEDITRGCEQTDDITILIARRDGEGVGG